MKTPALLPLLLCAAVLSCSDGDTFADALSDYRPWQLRLSFQFDHNECVRATSPSDSVPYAFAPLACAAPAPEQSRRIIDIAARHRAATATTADSSAARGRVDLLTPGSPAARDRAVHSLEAAVQLDSSAALLNDLAVAYAVRAVARQEPRDLLLATEAVLRAVARDSTFAPALFNRALLLDRLSLAGEAAAAWQSFTNAESGSLWAAEQPLREASRRALDLQPLREDSARAIFARWAAAVLADDSAAAAGALDTARSIGAQLRDRTVADAVRVIDAANALARRRLAEAHSAYEEGELAFERAAFTEARPLLERAVAGFAATSSPFGWWSALSLSGVRMYDGSTSVALQLADDVLQSADETRYPAVVARAQWVRALTEARLGTYERGLARYAQARSLYTAAGEVENAGAIEFLIAASLQLLGQARTAELRMLTALELLAPYPASTRLHDGLLGFGRHMASLELFETARALHGEGLRVAARTGRAKDPGEVHVRLAQTAVAAGRAADAQRHLTLGRTAYAAVTDPAMKSRGDVDIIDTESALIMQERPAEAVRLLSSAVDYFTRDSLAPGSIRALTRRSAALRAEGRHQEAASDLVRAIELYEHSVDGATAAARAALQESAAPAYDAMIGVQLALDRADSAFTWLMRSRGATAGAVMAAARRDGAHVLAYAVLPEELVTWIFDGQQWSAERSPTGADVVERSVAAFNSALRSRDAVAIRSTGATLYRMLVPAAAATVDALLVLPDRGLTALPFNALQSDAGRSLAEHARISIYAPGRVTVRPVARPARVLVASGARFDRQTFPDLSRLPGAELEAQRVSALYSDALLVTGTDATPDRIMRELRRHDVLHFAGHARALPATPGLSFLVTATGADGENRITAAEIAQLDLRHMRLVVLGACSSAERGAGRNGDINGLAQAFLAAGAASVVASVWEVEDEATAELLTRMHAGIARGLDAGAALRAAQLELLRSADPRLSAPAAWAGFQHYTS